MVMEATPTPQSVGREFVRQYYTLLNSAPTHLHRFYNHNSLFIHDGLDSPHRETKPMVGQKQIHQKIQQLNFRDCHAKITQVDSQATLGNGVVVQVTGELSNGGQPMRRFTQTFVLASQSPKKYYVHNDIFRYQDMLSDEDAEHDSGRSETDEDVDPMSTPQPQSQYYIQPQGAQPTPTHHPVLNAQPTQTQLQLQGGSPTPLMNPSVNGSIHIDEHASLPPQTFIPMQLVPNLPPAPVPAPAPAAAPAPAPTPSATAAQAPPPAAAQPPVSAAPPAPSQVPAPTPASAQTLVPAAAPVEDREEPAPAPEESQEEPPELSSPQGGALQAQGEAAEPEVQQQQQPKEEAVIAEDKNHEFEEPQLQETVNEPLTYATLVKGAVGVHKPMGRTSASSPPPQRAESHGTPSTTASSGGPGSGGMSGMGGLGGLSGSRPNAPRGPSRGSVPVAPARGVSRSSVDRQGPPRSSLNEDSTGDNRRRSSSNQYPDSHQIFVGNVPLHASENDLKDIFGLYGLVSEVRLHSNSNKPNNKNRNYAFVTFEESTSVHTVFSKTPILFPDHGQLNIERKQPRSGRPMQGGPMRGSQSGPPRGGPSGPNGPGGPSPRGRPVYSRGDGAPGGPGGPRNSGGGSGGGGGGPRSGYQNRR